MGDETPKKRGRPKKVKIDSISLSATDIDNAEIQDVIREALRTIVSDNKGIQKEEELI